jgi:hypothetical protein
MKELVDTVLPYMRIWLASTWVSYRGCLNGSKVIVNSTTPRFLRLDYQLDYDMPGNTKLLLVSHNQKVWVFTKDEVGKLVQNHSWALNGGLND